MDTSIEKFKDIHKGERAFIAATGPSLRYINGKLLDGEIVFGLNRAYLKKDLPITYMVTVNDRVEKHYGEEIVKLNCVAKFGSNLPKGNDVYKLRWTPDVPSFTGDPTKQMWQGHTVTYAAMQIAYFMGIKDLYLIGLDHYFEYPKEHFENFGQGYVASKGLDVNHFDPNYFSKGDEHAKAEPRVTEKAYLLARKAFEARGGSIYNASDSTALDEKFIPRIDLFNALTK